MSAYFSQERVWRMIAASHDDGQGGEVVTLADRERVGTHELVCEWRFLDRGEAVEFAESVGADPPHRIADLPHRCNGWRVETREPVAG